MSREFREKEMQMAYKHEKMYNIAHKRNVN